MSPVGPSRFVRVVMAPMTKMLNPLVATLAGRRHFPMAAQIHHVGRRTGTPYVTSVGARVHRRDRADPADIRQPIRLGAQCVRGGPVLRAAQRRRSTTPWHRNSSRPPKPHR